MFARSMEQQQTMKEGSLMEEGGARRETSVQKYLRRFVSKGRNIVTGGDEELRGVFLDLHGSTMDLTIGIKPGPSHREDEKHRGGEERGKRGLPTETGRGG